VVTPPILTTPEKMLLPTPLPHITKILPAFLTNYYEQARNKLGDRGDKEKS